MFDSHLLLCLGPLGGQRVGSVYDLSRFGFMADSYLCIRVTVPPTLSAREDHPRSGSGQLI